MKNAKTLATEPFTSTKELSTQASNLKRLTTGIDAVARRDVGWTDKERKLLADAAALIATLSNVHAQAARIKERDNKQAAQRESALRAALRDNFGAMQTIPDQVALVAAVASYRTRRGFDLDELPGAVSEAIDSLVYSLARNAPYRDMSPAAAVAAAWSKFGAEAPRLHADCAGLVERLAAEQQRRAAPRAEREAP